MNLTFFICKLNREFELCFAGEKLGMSTDVKGSNTSDLETVMNDGRGLSLSFRKNNLKLYRFSERNAVDTEATHIEEL